MGIMEYLAEEMAQEVRVEEGAKIHRQIVENLLKGTDHSLAKIASLAGVSPYFVKKVKSSLNKKSPSRRVSRTKSSSRRLTRAKA